MRKVNEEFFSTFSFRLTLFPASYKLRPTSCICKPFIVRRRMMLRTCEARLSVMSICVLVYLIFIPRETQHWMWRDRQIQHILTVEEIATEIFTLTTDEGFAQSFDFETRCYCWCSLASFFNSWEASRTLTFTLYLHHASFTCTQ